MAGGMVRPKTLAGLDDAIGELSRAIEALPDGAKKRQLLKSYQKLFEVRQHFTGDATIPTVTEEKPRWWLRILLVVLGTLLVLGVALLWRCRVRIFQLARVIGWFLDRILPVTEADARRSATCRDA